MLNLSSKKKLVRLQFQMPHDLKNRCELLIKFHKNNNIAIPMDTLVEYLLGRMLDESPDLADFRTYEATEALKPKQEAPKAAEAAEAADEASVVALAASANESAPAPVAPTSSSRPLRVAAPNPDASEIAKREIERRAASNQSNVTPAE